MVTPSGLDNRASAKKAMSKRRERRGALRFRCKGAARHQLRKRSPRSQRTICSLENAVMPAHSRFLGTHLADRRAPCLSIHSHKMSPRATAAPVSVLNTATPSQYNLSITTAPGRYCRYGTRANFKLPLSIVHFLVLTSHTHPYSGRQTPGQQSAQRSQYY